MATAKGGSGSRDRRIIALERSCTRRRRLDDTLRAALSAQRSTHAALEAARDAKAAQVEHEAGILRFYQHRIEAMMTGTEAFSLDEMNGCRRYLDVVGERLRALQGELAQAEAAVHTSTAAIEKIQRDIALNQGRIDLCGERIGQIRRQHDEVAENASDEEAEETALSRRFQQQRAQA
jgi:type III secretion system HrpB7-like protein